MRARVRARRPDGRSDSQRVRRASGPRPRPAAARRTDEAAESTLSTLTLFFPFATSAFLSFEFIVEVVMEILQF